MSISAAAVRRAWARPTRGEGAKKMKYLMFVCWDAERMDAQVEPDPNALPDVEPFPWVDNLQAKGIWVQTALGEPRLRAQCALFAA
jgi:hypothetical protein